MRRAVLYFVFIAIITIQCSTINLTKVDGVMHSGVEFILRIVEDQRILIEVINDSEVEIFLPNPGCYPIGRITVNDGKITQKIAIKPSFECAKKLSSILPHKREKYYFIYQLSDLFDLQNRVAYKIVLDYNGEITDSKGNIIKTDGLTDEIIYVNDE